MNLPILDINAGDSISTMVSKINSNFDMLSLLGGGPIGIQGIQGIRGMTGLQGAQGIQGYRGSKWHIAQTPSELDTTDAIPGDIGIVQNGEMYIYDGMQYVTSGTSLQSVLESPFVLDTANHVINQKNNEANPIVLGTNENNASVASLKPAIAIANINGSEYNTGLLLYKETAIGGHRNEIGLDSSEKLMLKSSKGVSVVCGTPNASGVSLTVNDDLVNISYMANLEPAGTNISPLVSSNGFTGSLDKYDANNKWKWGLQGSALVPNNSGDNGIGCENRRLKSAYTTKDFSLNFEAPAASTDNSYIGFGYIDNNTKHDVLKIGSNGISVGNGGTDFNNNFSSYSNGITISGGGTKGGHVTLNGSTDTSNCVAQEESGNQQNTQNPLVYNGIANSAIPYVELTVGTGKTYNDLTRNTSPVITANKVASPKDCNANNLRIKGYSGTEEGGDVVIDGGNSVGGYTKFGCVGGSVYISGGINFSNNVVANNKIKGYPFNFGDVVIGLNPNNHAGLKTGGNNNANIRNTTKDNISGVNYYDIYNFTAHANNIMLDSDANNRVINGYGANYPKIKSLGDATMQINGLATVYGSTPFMIGVQDSNKYQFVSGINEFVVRHTNIDDEIVSQRFSSIGEAFPITGPDRTTTSLYTHYVTNWQKVGNIVNCTTKIAMLLDAGSSHLNSNNLYVVGSKLVTESDYMNNTLGYLKSNPEKVPCTVIELPLFVGDDNGNQLCSYIGGCGSMYCETNMGSESLFNSILINGTEQIFANNSHKITASNNGGNLEVVVSYQGFGNANHNSQGRIIYRDDVAKSYSNSLLADIIGLNHYTVDINQNCMYIVPERFMTKGSGNNEIKKTSYIQQLYSTLVLNYTYMLNPGFGGDFVKFQISGHGTSPTNQQQQHFIPGGGFTI